MESLYKKALKLGASHFDNSNLKNKRFYVIYNNQKIHFGSKTGSTFIDHHDPIKRKNWLARHTKIINKEGIPFYKIKTSPSFWSLNLLW